MTGLIGPNGAGKTTLFNVITGLQDPTAGRVVLDGVDITDKSPYRRARMGIARTFQKLEAFSSLSARENVLVAAEQCKTWDRSRGRAGAIADEMLARVGISDVADFMVGTLPTGTARLVELARALATNPRALLLDEPSSGLNEDETREMAALLRTLVAGRPRRPARRARHVLRDGHLRVDLRARLRPDDRHRLAGGDPGRSQGPDGLSRLGPAEGVGA